MVRRHPNGRRELAISVSLQLPVGTGRVAPTSLDPVQPPRIEWSFVRELENLRRLGDGWRLAVAIMAASGITADPAALVDARAVGEADLRAHVVATHSAFYHGVGTCRMGDDGDPARVVDPHCRVVGVDRLLVVDASVIPAVPRTNTNIAVIAVAERIASELRETAGSVA